VSLEDQWVEGWDGREESEEGYSYIGGEMRRLSPDMKRRADELSILIFLWAISTRWVRNRSVLCLQRGLSSQTRSPTLWRARSCSDVVPSPDRPHPLLLRSRFGRTLLGDGLPYRCRQGPSTFSPPLPISPSASGRFATSFQADPIDSLFGSRRTCRNAPSPVNLTAVRS
jgi:hypothetical protein